MEEDIKILEDYIKLIKKGYCEECNELCNIYGTPTYPARKISEATEHLIKAYKELKEENEKLKSDNLEYQRTQDIFDERTYRKKYLEERRKEEPNLLYPDSDEIYKRYYKLKEENATLKKAHNISENVTIQDITNVMNKSLEDFNKYYIPVSLVEEKIEELDEELEIMKVDAMYGRYKEYGSKLSFEKQFSYKYGMHDILQELLERRK